MPIAAVALHSKKKPRESLSSVCSSNVPAMHKQANIWYQQAFLKGKRDTGRAIKCIWHEKGLTEISSSLYNSIKLFQALKDRWTERPDLSVLKHCVFKDSYNVDLQKKCHLIVMEGEIYLYPTPLTSILHCIEPIHSGLGLLNASFRCSWATAITQGIHKAIKYRPPVLLFLPKNRNRGLILYKVFTSGKERCNLWREKKGEIPNCSFYHKQP